MFKQLSFSGQRVDTNSSMVNFSLSLSLEFSLLSWFLTDACIFRRKAMAKYFTPRIINTANYGTNNFALSKKWSAKFRGVCTLVHENFTVRITVGHHCQTVPCKRMELCGSARFGFLQSRVALRKHPYIDSIKILILYLLFKISVKNPCTALLILIFVQDAFTRMCETV